MLSAVYRMDKIAVESLSRFSFGVCEYNVSGLGTIGRKFCLIRQLLDVYTVSISDSKFAMLLARIYLLHTYRSFYCWDTNYSRSQLF